MFRSLRFQLPALFLAGVIIFGLVAASVAFQLLASYTLGRARADLRREAAGITRLLDKLETAGLARRERSSPDRRQVLCYITAEGLGVLAELDAAMKEADNVAVGDLSESEQRQLLKLLETARGRTRG